MQSESIEALAAALALAQKDVKNAVRSEENPFFNSKYADLASVYDACRKAMADNSLSVVQYGGFEEGQPVLYTQLMHKSGQWLRGYMPVFVPAQPEDDGEQKAKRVNKSQGYGSSMTYMRRYALAAMLGVATEDDDGNAAGEKPVQAPKQEGEPHTTSTAPASDPQKRKIIAMTRELGWGKQEVAKYFALKKIDWENITKSEASSVIDDLEPLVAKVKEA